MLKQLNDVLQVSYADDAHNYGKTYDVEKLVAT